MHRTHAIQMTKKLLAFSILPDEKKTASRAIKNLADVEAILFYDEVVCVSLLALAHIKDNRMKMEAIQVVHTSMRLWCSKDASRAKIAQDLLSSNKILAHSVALIKDQNPSYPPTKQHAWRYRRRFGEDPILKRKRSRVRNPLQDEQR